MAGGAPGGPGDPASPAVPAGGGASPLTSGTETVPCSDASQHSATGSVPGYSAARSPQAAPSLQSCSIIGAESFARSMDTGPSISIDGVNSSMGQRRRRTFIDGETGHEEEEAAATDFEVLRMLGKGDVGKVFLVRHRATGHHHAMKVMFKADIIKRKKLRRLLTERMILTEHDHPMLSRLLWSFQSRTKIYFILEYCPGGEFFRFLQRQPQARVSENAAKFYAGEVLLAFESLHIGGYIYRDIKPENILMDGEGHLILTDFDLSQKTSAQPEVSNMSKGGKERPNVVTPPTKEGFGSFVGTAEYIAPEIIRDSGHNYGVDWWGLGILIYEMLFATTPFKGTDQRETFSNIQSKELTFPSSPHISESCRSIIRALLRQDPEERLGTKAGAAEVREHRWFKDINFSRIRDTAPPLKPIIADISDPSKFPKYTGEEPLSDGEPDDTFVPKDDVKAALKYDDTAVGMRVMVTPVSRTPDQRFCGKVEQKAGASVFVRWERPAPQDGGELQKMPRAWWDGDAKPEVLEQTGGRPSVYNHPAYNSQDPFARFKYYRYRAGERRYQRSRSPSGPLSPASGRCTGFGSRNATPHLGASSPPGGRVSQASNAAISPVGSSHGAVRGSGQQQSDDASSPPAATHHHVGSVGARRAGGMEVQVAFDIDGDGFATPSVIVSPSARGAAAASSSPDAAAVAGGAAGGGAGGAPGVPGGGPRQRHAERIRWDAEEEPPKKDKGIAAGVGKMFRRLGRGVSPPTSPAVERQGPAAGFRCSSPPETALPAALQPRPGASPPLKPMTTPMPPRAISPAAGSGGGSPTITPALPAASGSPMRLPAAAAGAPAAPSFSDPSIEP